MNPLEDKVNTSLLRRLQYNRLFHMILLALAVVTCYFGLWNAYFVSEDDFYLTGQIWHRDTLGEAAAGLGNGVRFLNYSMIWVKTRLFD
ncbi:MAG: hypothetical protein K8J31_22195, partial [Anaerolineae bacterium]|nr:hypothetical protein [Anaerolineae bacterium]